MRELFIYYQVPAAHVDTARGIVDAFQAKLRGAHPGLATRLLRRPEQQMELQTWMEVYAHPDAGGVTAEVEAAIATAAEAMEGFTVGARHVEVFIPCA